MSDEGIIIDTNYIVCKENEKPVFTVVEVNLFCWDVGEVE